MSGQSGYSRIVNNQGSSWAVMTLTSHDSRVTRYCFFLGVILLLSSHGTPYERSTGPLAL